VLSLINADSHFHLPHHRGSYRHGLVHRQRPGFAVTAHLLQPEGACRWAARAEKPLGQLEPDKGYGLAAATQLIFSGDGQRLAALVVPALWPGEEVIKPGENNVVLVWNVPDKRLVGEPLRASQSAVSSITLSDDGKTLLAGTTTGDIVFKDLDAGDAGVQVMRATSESVASPANSIISMTIDKDKRLAASVAKGKTLRLWDVGAKKMIGSRQLKSSLDEFYSAAFSLDGKRLATCTDKGSLALWDVAPTLALGGYIPRQFAELKNITFDPGGNILAAAADGRIFLWDLAGHRDIKTEVPSFSEDIYQPLNNVVGVAFSKDGKRLASVGINGRVIVWDWDGSTLKQAGTLKTKNFTENVAFDSRLDLMVSESAMSDISLWEMQGKKSAGTLPVRFGFGDQYFVHFALSPDDSTLAAIGGDGELTVWNVVDPPRPVKLAVPATGDLTSLAFSHDGAFLATGSKSGLITIWRLDTLRPSFTLRAPGDVHSLAFSADSKTLASGTGSGLIDLWDVGEHLSLGQINTGSPDAVSPLAFSPDGKILASGVKGGIILWDVSLESWKSRARDIINLALK
jgi:WD40 repeat protein